jgi:hypothetical protein
MELSILKFNFLIWTLINHTHYDYSLAIPYPMESNKELSSINT